MYIERMKRNATRRLFNLLQTAAKMRCLLLLALLAVASAGQVVQFVVYAPNQADVTHLFPGAQVEFTWNNVFIVTIWTSAPDQLILDIQQLLDANSAQIQTIIPPFTLEAATKKWIEYNLVWIALLLLVFLCGCACGAMLIKNCLTIKRPRPRKGPWPTSC